ncbi:MAG TPA: Uma2 family endonuclease [Gemmata sp.]|jgi:Uma2 family endonuclease|nr:Uma2 family endonuclease [Gemmata sp.]
MTTATISPPQAEVGPHPLTWTTEQYYKLGELGFFQGKRVELIYGEIFEMSPINWFHTVGTTKVGDVLRVIFAGQGWINTQNPLAMTDSHPQPDVSVIPGRIADYADHPQRAMLIVEVSDTTLFYDTTTKAELYATAGVPEYWVLDLDGKRLLVFRDPVQLPKGLGASAYQTHFSLGSTETIAPLAVPNGNITVSELLP